MKIKSWLVSGAGNTFHIIEEQDLLSPTSNLSDLSQKICQKNFADGVIFLKTQNDPEINWNFYNNDGTVAEMCGNATRCVGHYLSEKTHSKNLNWTLHTVAGPIHISKINSTEYLIGMTPIQKLKSGHGFFCNTGVPHLVLELENFSDFKKFKSRAAELRRDPSFNPTGTNVTFVSQTNQQDHIRAVSFERGVEDFTLACGTGAVAAALFQKNKTKLNKILVSMPGGDLFIDLANESKPLMKGPAIKIQECEYES